MLSLNQQILPAYAQLSWLLCDFTWIVKCQQRFTSNQNEWDALESHFSCWANPPNISIKVKGNLNNGKTLHLSKLQRSRASHKSARANVWHLWYRKRIFPAPLLSHCHELQPPTKRHDSASYLFMVNNGCGATLMSPVMNISPHMPKERCQWFCSKRCITYKVLAGMEHSLLRGIALLRHGPPEGLTHLPMHTVQAQPCWGSKVPHSTYMGCFLSTLQNGYSPPPFSGTSMVTTIKTNQT